MFGLGKKKKEVSDEELVVSEEPKEVNSISETGNAAIDQLSVKVEKLNASFEAFSEIRKSFSERFNHVSEQIGELRAMILDRDKTIQSIELKAIKAADLVETVQPEKIMVSVQKQEAKIEALKANLEGNESIMDRVMDELKEVKKKVEFFRGIEEIVKLSEETKKELIEIKKIEAKIALNTDKVDTIYGEMRNEFQKIDLFNSTLQEAKAGVEENAKGVQYAKDKISELATKSDLERVINKVQRYVDALKDLEKKSSMAKDIDKLKSILDGLK